ncbi:MAG: hypothetical protein AUI84_14980 [Delftia sp. 13_1_40CM_3_66_6]|nr:MAG: hypothetical protein AUG53_06820 [Delftia sp. 13_1_20CM_4_67_18]OLE93401.1 MAG: hypothetical protein AUI84_14980 [Delftia sp. 13_1_40CM_3_66_6]
MVSSAHSRMCACIAVHYCKQNLWAAAHSSVLIMRGDMMLRVELRISQIAISFTNLENVNSKT